MFGVKLGFLRKAVLLEAGAAIILFGALANHHELLESGAIAIGELKARGYNVPSSFEPVRVYPGQTELDFTSAHAGGWRPGIILLRERPMGGLPPEIYLRHELLHEASFRTCGGKLPLWAEEATAINFSRELSFQPTMGPLCGSEFDHLKEQARTGARLDATSYSALSRLIGTYGWPSTPCTVSGEIEKLLEITNDHSKPVFSYVITSLLSGMVLESRGDLKSKHPPGSLLKIPYAAALKEASNEAIGHELSASDTPALLNRKDFLDMDVFRFLTSHVRDAALANRPTISELSGKDEAFWHQYLGERDQEGNFPFEANLNELALMLRASLLLKPERFSGLSRNGFTPGSTLYNEPEQRKKILSALHAMCKTGTASDGRGNPLVGHLMVAWPEEEPVFLAVFRSIGTNGASNLVRAASVLREWSSHHSNSYGQVRVRVMSLTPRSSWEVLDQCPSLERQERHGMKARFSTCGLFKIVSSARGSRSERSVRGVLESTPDGGTVILKTDPESYANGVLASEAQDIRGEAGKALRAVIVWNAIHGMRHHPETSSLCDSTHCMVFQGSGSDKVQRTESKTDPVLLKLLDSLAQKNKWHWLPFSEGGVEEWERRIPSEDLREMVHEPTILDVRRERTRSNQVLIHLIYPDNQETVSCEVFRNTLKLPSCPETVQLDVTGSNWLFKGIGKGHGEGLSVEKARTLGRSGYNAQAILYDAYNKGGVK